MTDTNEAIRQIEERLGSEGTRAQAEAVFKILRERGLITFDATSGFDIDIPDDWDDDGATWNSILAEADNAN